MPLQAFTTPLQEVCAQLNLAGGEIQDLPAASFRRALRADYPQAVAQPSLIGPLPDETPPGAAFAPAYRFIAPDQKNYVQLGTRILTVNTRDWTGGYPAFRHRVGQAFGEYEKLESDIRADEASLGFYNSVSVQNLAEAAAIVAGFPSIDDKTEFDGFRLDYRRRVPCGIIDARIRSIVNASTSARALQINYIVRTSTVAGPSLTDNYLTWMDEAHDCARSFFWEMLSPEAQQAWRATVVAS